MPAQTKGYSMTKIYVVALHRTPKIIWWSLKRPKHFARLMLSLRPLHTGFKQYKTGNFPEATIRLEKGLELLPSEEFRIANVFLDALAECYEETGRKEEAKFTKAESRAYRARAKKMGL